MKSYKRNIYVYRSSWPYNIEKKIVNNKNDRSIWISNSIFGANKCCISSLKGQGHLINERSFDRQVSLVFCVFFNFVLLLFNTFKKKNRRCLPYLKKNISNLCHVSFKIALKMTGDLIIVILEVTLEEIHKWDKVKHPSHPWSKTICYKLTRKSFSVPKLRFTLPSKP